MARAIVVFDSKFGNTERLAMELAAGIREGRLETDCVRYDQVDAQRLAGYDLVAVGGPTQNATVSKPLGAFLETLPKGSLQGRTGFAFDTKIDSRFAGSAAKRIQYKLEKAGLTMTRPPASAFVAGREGPLAAGSEARFRELGAEIGKEIRARKP